MQVLTAAIGSKLEPVLVLTDSAGQVVAEGTNGVLGYTCPGPAPMPSASATAITAAAPT